MLVSPHTNERITAASPSYRPRASRFSGLTKVCETHQRRCLCCWLHSTDAFRRDGRMQHVRDGAAAPDCSPCAFPLLSGGCILLPARSTFPKRLRQHNTLQGVREHCQGLRSRRADRLVNAPRENSLVCRSEPVSRMPACPAVAQQSCSKGPKSIHALDIR